MSNPMAVSLDNYNAGRTGFTQHYFLDECNTDFGGQDIQLSWSSFASAVTNFISANDVEADTVALRFVYCYDTTGNALYLRLQICTMMPDPKLPNTYDLVASPCAWYAIENGNITATTDTDLFDQAYLSYFYYCSAVICSEGNLINLASDTAATTYARTVVLPWSAEILQMYLDNSSPDNAILCFAACAFQASSVCTYPHTLVLYLIDGSGNTLMDNSVVSGFEMKGADMGTTCPEICNVYVLPTS